MVLIVLTRIAAYMLLIYAFVHIFIYSIVFDGKKRLVFLLSIINYSCDANITSSYVNLLVIVFIRI